MNYRNKWAEEENIDPRAELEEFVISNRKHINRDQIREVSPNLNAYDEEEWLKKFIQVNSPYKVLQTCFYTNELKRLAVKQLGVGTNANDIVDEILYKLGFKKKVEPTGLSQYIDNLEQLQGDVNKMAEAVDDLLRKLFLFYTYALRRYAFAEADVVDTTEELDAVDDAADAGEKADSIITADEKADPIGTIEKLLQNYRKKDSKSLGDLYLWLKKLMALVQINKQLTNYCQRQFQREVPLNPSQIAEIGIFRTYRNLAGSGHLIDSASWKKHKNKSETDLNDMDDATRWEWEGSWNNVLREYEFHQTLPTDQMFQRMAVFLRKFLNSLSENQIYPKVIVIRKYSFDEYGTFKIYADSSNLNEGIILTDHNLSDFNSDTFTKFYYHSRTNPVGIEPILVSKEELDDWGTQSKEDTKNQKEK